MDRFSEAKAIVAMLADYMQTPEEDREAREGSEQAQKAWQIVRRTFESSNPQAFNVVTDFENKPLDMYQDELAKYLYKYMSQDRRVAHQLSELLTQFHKQRQRAGNINIQNVKGSVAYGGVVAGRDIVVVKGDAVKGGSRIKIDNH
jgi:hypothetical protein